MSDLDQAAQAAIDEQARLWESEFKPRLEELERLGGTVAGKIAGFGDAQEAVDRVNARLDELEQRTALQAATAHKTDTTAGKLDTGMGDYFRGKTSSPNSPASVAGKLSLDTETSGAVLAPNEFVAKVIEIMHDMVMMREYAQVIPTSRRAIEIPRAGDQDIPTWEEDDSSPRSETPNPAMGLELITTRGQYYRLFLGNGLLEDSAIDLESWVVQRAARRFAEQEGEAFLTGNNVGKPEGVTVNPTLVAGAIESDVAAIKADDIVDLFMAVPQVYALRGTWMLDRTHLAAIRKFKDTAGAFIWNPAFAEGNPATIMGRPYIISETMKTVAAAATNDIIIAFGDLFEGYVIADRLAISALRDPYSTGGAGVYMHLRKRVGGQVVQPAALKLMKKGS